VSMKFQLVFDKKNVEKYESNRERKLEHFLEEILRGSVDIDGFTLTKRTYGTRTYEAYEYTADKLTGEDGNRVFDELENIIEIESIETIENELNEHMDLISDEDRHEVLKQIKAIKISHNFLLCI